VRVLPGRHAVRNSHSRKIRQLMAQTGMNYTKAALELDRREAAEKVNLVMGSDDVADNSVMSKLARVHASEEQTSRVTGLMVDQARFDELR